YFGAALFQAGFQFIKQRIGMSFAAIGAVGTEETDAAFSLSFYLPPYYALGEGCDSVTVGKNQAQFRVAIRTAKNFFVNQRLVETFKFQTASGNLCKAGQIGFLYCA